MRQDDQRTMLKIGKLGCKILKIYSEIVNMQKRQEAITTVKTFQHSMGLKMVGLK